MKRLRAGFTLIEVLVVVAIIALLVSILLPSLSRARHQAKRQVCASSLHQLGIIWQMYGDAHKGSFPYIPTLQLGNWTLLPVEQHNLFEKGKYGIRGGAVFYCPYYEVAYGAKPADDWYTPRVVTLTSGQPMNTYYIGYALYAYRSEEYANIKSLPDTPQYQHLKRIIPIEKNSDKLASRRPLLLDEIQYYGPSGIYGTGGFARATHREGASIPAGGNSVYADGHGEWRKFKSMDNRLDRVPLVDSKFMYPVKQSGADDFLRWY